MQNIFPVVCFLINGISGGQFKKKVAKWRDRNRFRCRRFENFFTKLREFVFLTQWQPIWTSRCGTFELTCEIFRSKTTFLWTRSAEWIGKLVGNVRQMKNGDSSADQACLVSINYHRPRLMQPPRLFHNYFAFSLWSKLQLVQWTTLAMVSRSLGC